MPLQSIIDIVPYKSDNLAVLNTKTSFGEYISFLDSSYWENKDKYIVGNKYYFNLCAITYSWAIRKTDYHNFDEYINSLEEKDESNGRVPDSTFFFLFTNRSPINLIKNK